MNELFKSRSSAYARLADYLRESIRTGVIPIQHQEAADTIIDAEASGVLYALEALKQLPEKEPLKSIYSLLSLSQPYIPALISGASNPALTFQNYVACDTNRLSYKLANSLVKGSSHVFFEILFICSDAGQGKTHLLSAISNEMKENTLFASLPELDIEFDRARQLGRRAEFHHWILQHKSILIDDFQFIANHTDLQMDLLLVLKGAAVRGIPVVICSNRKLARLSNVDSELTAIIGAGVTTELHLPLHDTLTEIAKLLAGKTTIPDNVLDYLAQNIKDNVRHLVAAVKQIIALSEQTDTPITIDLARAVAPTEQDLQSGIPNLEPALDVVFSGVHGGSSEPVDIEAQRKKAAAFKEMLASAQNEEEQCLALQIAISERIKELRTIGEAEEVARLKIALEHLRAGKIREALSCTAP